jgi:hypothetical protein
MKFFGRKETGATQEGFAALSPAQKYATLQAKGGETVEALRSFQSSMETLENGRAIGQADGGYNPAADDARQSEIFRFTQEKLSELGYPVSENDLDTFLDIPGNDDDVSAADSESEPPVMRSVA